jgi:Putative transmembrane protein (PGPGW)
MIEWIKEHDTLLWWLTAASVVTFFASLIIVPILVARIPPDYFARESRPESPWGRHHPAVRVILRIGKNTLGILLMLAGLAMLALPGQGLLTLLIGFLLLDFPGKYRFEKWLISRRSILKAINWTRRRAGRAAICVEGRDC